MQTILLEKRAGRSLPRATLAAPVRVAKSTTRLGRSLESSVARTRASARMSRPSASVFVISVLLPLRARMTSPGLRALPLIEFSAIGNSNLSRTFSLLPRTSNARAIAYLASCCRGYKKQYSSRQYLSSAGHVPLHCAHSSARFDVQSAGVEGDPLADDGHQWQGSVDSALSVPTNFKESWLSGCFGCHSNSCYLWIILLQELLNADHRSYFVGLQFISEINDSIV